MAHKKVTRLQDTFKTIGTKEHPAKVMTRRQLSNKIANVNRQLKKAANYLTPKEWKATQEQFVKNLASIYGRGAEWFTLKGFETEEDLQKINRLADKALDSVYMHKGTYTEYKRGQRQTWKDKYNLTDSQVDTLFDFFKSPEWQELKEKDYFDSKNIVDEITEEISTNNTPVEDIVDAIREMTIYQDTYEATSPLWAQGGSVFQYAQEGAIVKQRISKKLGKEIIKAGKAYETDTPLGANDFDPRYPLNFLYDRLTKK